jgi:hypothetical protein
MIISKLLSRFPRIASLIVTAVGVIVTGCTMPVALPPIIVTAIPIPVNMPPPPPTPRSRFDNMPPGAVITLVALGNIPANTPVLISTMTFNPSSGWVYSVSTLDYQQFATATDSDLAMAPGFNPAQATPIPRFEAPGYWGECYTLITTEALTVQGAPAGSASVIPAGTRVRVSAMTGSAYYLGSGQWAWFYDVVQAGGLYAAHAREDQLAPAPGVDPMQMVGPTPTAPFAFGMGGLNYVTLESVGEIPAGTQVSLGSGHYGCGEWIYSIFTDDGLSEEARASQIGPVQGFDHNAPTATLPPVPPTP